MESVKCCCAEAELTLIFLFAGVNAGFPRDSSPLLRSVRIQLALTSVARVLLSPSARELVRVQNVQDGERRGPMSGGTLVHICRLYHILKSYGVSCNLKNVFSKTIDNNNNNNDDLKLINGSSLLPVYSS